MGGGGDDASSEEGLCGGVSVERGLGSDGTAVGCELSALLAVIAKLNGPSRFPMPSWSHDIRTEVTERALQLYLNPPQILLVRYLSFHRNGNMLICVGL